MPARKIAGSRSRTSSLQERHFASHKSARSRGEKGQPRFNNKMLFAAWHVTKYSRVISIIETKSASRKVNNPRVSGLGLGV